MTNCFEDYLNDFEIIAEQGISQDNERSGSETNPTDMSSSGGLDTNARAGKTRKMDPNEIHSRRESQWNNEKEELMKQIKTLEKELERNNEDNSARRKQDETRIREMRAKYATLEKEYEELADRQKHLQSKYNDLQTQNQNDQHQKDEMVTELQSKLEKLETQYENLQNEKLKLESVVESERKQNANYTGRIGAMDESIEKKDKQIDQLKGKVKEQENSYKELREINNKLEEEQNEMRTARNNLQSVMGIKDQENVKLEITCKELKTELEDRKEQNRVLQEERDKLDDELIKMKLEVNKMGEQKEDFREKYERSEKKRQELIETGNASTQKSEQVLRKAQNESQQSMQALNALNHENDVLRERMQQLENENSALKSGKVLLEKEIKNMNDELSALRERNGSGPEKFRKPYEMNSSKKLQASFQNSQSSFRANNDPDHQWYTTDHGEKVLHEIYVSLKDIFPSIELSRESATKNITIFITIDGGKSASVLFPKDFPLSDLQLKCGGRMRKVEFQYDSSKSSGSEFSAEVSKRICETILSSFLS